MEKVFYMYHVADSNQEDIRLSKYIDYLNHDKKKMRAILIGDRFVVYESGHKNDAVISEYIEYYEAGTVDRKWRCTYNPQKNEFVHTAVSGGEEKRIFYGIHYIGWDNHGFWGYVPHEYDNSETPVILQVANSYDEYQEQMDMFKVMDASTNFASGIVLTEKEKELDELLQNKYKEAMASGTKYVYAARNTKEKPTYYPPIHPFYEAKKRLYPGNAGDMSPAAEWVYKFMRDMPKGGNLHLHTSATLSVECLMELVTYYDKGIYNRENIKWEVYVQKQDITVGQVTTYKNTLYLVNNIDKKKVKSIYVRYSDMKDEEIEDLKSDLCFMDDEKVKSIPYIWDAFNQAFSRVSTILKVKAFYKDYYIKAFSQQCADNIDYIELRCGTPKFSDTAGDIVFEDHISATDIVETKSTDENPYLIMKDIAEIVRRDYPDFTLKLVISGTRAKEPSDVVREIEKVYDYINAPDNDNFIIGYDLVGEEDRGKKTSDYAKVILESDKAKNVPYYFHDGESCWADDDNVYAAFSLGTRRVGHGLNSYRFPSLMSQMADKKICFEVCPISNQLLRYTSDLRMHPLGEFINRNIPCVICSDDPLILGNSGLSYDFWMCCLGQLLTLGEIKQLILNSYEYSGMNDVEKLEKKAAWEKKWNDFIDKIR